MFYILLQKILVGICDVVFNQISDQGRNYAHNIKVHLKVCFIRIITPRQAEFSPFLLKILVDRGNMNVVK